MYWQTVDELKIYLERKTGFDNLGEESSYQSPHFSQYKNSEESFVFRCYHQLIKNLYDINFVSQNQFHHTLNVAIRNYVDFVVPNVAKEITQSDSFLFFTPTPAGLLYYMDDYKVLQSKSYSVQTYMILENYNYKKQPSKTNRGIILEFMGYNSFVNKIIKPNDFIVAEEKESKIIFIPYCMELDLISICMPYTEMFKKLPIFFRGAKFLISKNSNPIIPVNKSPKQITDLITNI